MVAESVAEQLGDALAVVGIQILDARRLLASPGSHSTVGGMLGRQQIGLDMYKAIAERRGRKRRTKEMRVGKTDTDQEPSSVEALETLGHR